MNKNFLRIFDYIFVLRPMLFFPGLVNPAGRFLYRTKARTLPNPGHVEHDES